ncbi:hypothetical protein LINGRAHAP2_LOCUS20349 [Linum grandiflorum]
MDSGGCLSMSSSQITLWNFTFMVIFQLLFLCS